MTSGRGRFILIILAGVLTGTLALLAGPLFYSGIAYSGEFCGQCHVIRPSVDQWQSSAHREIPCEDCHGSAFTFDISAHSTHWRRLYLHATGSEPERILLRDEHIDAVVERCEGCHKSSYARWMASGHSMSYGDVFLDPDQNRTQLLVSDCLRCHGMFFEGDIDEVVSPLDLEGPWQFVRPELSERAAIPCLACHRMHSDGSPLESPDYSEPSRIASKRSIRTPSLGFYDRHENMYFSFDNLPLPAMRSGSENVVVSPDPRQGVCYQCHAPHPTLEVGSGDDRTCIGVHEGISCLGCHSNHSLDTRESCETCHPKMSNCGLDVAGMDTTFRSPDSAHNIHFVKCADCHPAGAPPSKRNIAGSNF